MSWLLRQVVSYRNKLGGRPAFTHHFNSSPTTHKPDPLTHINSILTTSISKPHLLEPSLDQVAHMLNPHILSSVLLNPPDLRVGFRFYIWAVRHRSLRAWEAGNLVVDLILREEDGAGFRVYLDTVEEVRRCGVAVPSDAFLVLVSSYWKAGKAEKAVEVFGKMVDFDCKPNIYAFNAILYVMINEGVVLLALGLYSQMLKSNCGPNVATYSILIDGLCKSGKVEDALHLFDEMAQRGVMPNRITYTIVLSGLCQAKRAYDAQVLLDKMMSSGCGIDNVTCNGMLAGFCKLGRVDEAFLLLRFFESQGYALGVKGYSYLIDGLFKVGRFEEANKWFHKMCEENIDADLWLYTIMIRGLCKEGRIKDAWKLVQEMTDKGLVPDTVCYNALIKGFCDVGLLEEAKSLKLEISKNNCFPDAHTYTILICGMCRNGLVGEAKQVFEEMEKLGCFPSVVTFNALIDGLCDASKLEEAYLMFYKMELGRNPSLFLRLSQGTDRVMDKESLQKMIGRLCDSGLYLKAYRLLTKMADILVQPDIVTYNILIKGMCKSGNIDGAFKLFREIQLKGCLPDSITYGTLMSGLYRANREEEAIGMLDEMIKNGCAPTSSIYKSLMTWSCRKGKALVSISLWLDYLRRFKVREERAIILIEEHFLKGELEEVVRGLLEMDFKFKDFDMGLYTIWLIGMCQAHKVEEALKIFRVLREFGITVNPPSCVKLISVLCKQTKLDLAIDVFLYSLERGYMLMPRVCNLLLSSLLRSKAHVKDAIFLLSKMDTMGYDLDAHLSGRTKSLWQHHYKTQELAMAVQDGIQHHMASSG